MIKQYSKYKLIIYFFISTLLGQTPSQIEQAKKIIKKNNLSSDQVRKIARSKGYSDEQINQAIEKEKSQDNNISNQKNTNQTVDNESEIIDSKTNLEQKENNNFEKTDLKSDVIDEKIIIENEVRKKLNYFGYDIFEQDPKLFQSSSVGAVDPKYLIGPDDEIIVMLWGETQFRQVFKVNREGFIFIPEIGQVFVNGLNFTLLESKLFRIFSQSYESLNPQNRNATTFLDISLGNLRPLRIQVLGQVPQPGVYTVSPSTTLFSSLYYFNGPSIRGSLRDIHLIRDGKKITSIDFYDFLLTGRKLKDFKLQRDDVIFIPKRLKTVSINGEINSPGIYELNEKETLIDLVSIAGGLKTTAYLDRAQIDRITPFDKRKEIKMDRMFIDVDLNEYLKTNVKFNLQDEDKIQIFSVLNSRQNVVEIYGGIVRPGSYDIGDSLTLSELIKKTGLLGDAFLDRVDIIRLKNDLTEELIKLDLKKILEGDAEEDIKLKNSDYIKVYSTKEMIPNSFINISGYLKKPGTYMLRSGMTLYDLLFSSGGFNDPVFKKGLYLERAELIRTLKDNNKKIITFNPSEVLQKKGKASLPLVANDEIYLYSLDEIEGAVKYVSIEGFVKKPGRYELYSENMTIFDLIFKAGGLDDPSHKIKTFLERADLVRYNEDYLSKKIISFNLSDLLKTKKNNLILKPEDKIRIYPRSAFKKFMDIAVYGDVIKPGIITYKDQMTIIDLILEVGGVNSNVISYKVEIVRRNFFPKKDNLLFSLDEFTLLNPIHINNPDSSKLYQENSKIKLKPADQVYIRIDKSLNNIKSIRVEGEVKYPGDYILQNNNETIYDIVIRSGGLKPKGNPMATTFLRNEKKINLDINSIMKKEGKSKDNLILRSGDILNIGVYSEVIEVLGAVNSEGVYKYVKNSRIKDAINFAGGLSQNADEKSIYVKHINGTSFKYSKFFGNHKIYDGSVITVNSDKREKVDKTEYLKEVTMIMANFAQVISMYLLTKN